MIDKECGCSYLKPTYLKIGKALKVRNRLQMQFFNMFHRLPWLDQYGEQPHNHQILAAVWYMDKSLLSAGEAVLIDLLKPVHNVKDRGFGNVDLWKPRRSDVSGVEWITLESKHVKGNDFERDTSIRNVPGVYLMYVDPGEELEVLMPYVLPHAIPKNPLKAHAVLDALEERRRLQSAPDHYLCPIGG